MKKIISISLGSSELDGQFSTRFLGEQFRVSRIGTDHDVKQAGRLIEEWRDQVDTMGLGMVREHYTVGTDRFIRPETRKLEKLAGETPVTTGARLREIVQEWTVRSAMLELGNIFNNAKILFLSGTLNYRLASILSEYTDNLTFADPVAQFGLPNLLHSLRALSSTPAAVTPSCVSRTVKTGCPPSRRSSFSITWCCAGK